MATKSLPRVHAFRPGRHQPTTGPVLEFSESDLGASAAAYDPSVYRAPLVVGHPQLDAPAYGWVDRVICEDDGLYVDSVDVEADFADMVREQRFPNRSASFFPPGHPRNPVPGVWYLKHVGFLGATPPAVRGLKPVFSADDAECVTVEFAAADGWTVKSLFRRLREWLIAREGVEAADQVVPEWSIDGIEPEPVPDPVNPMFATPNNPDEGDTMSAEEKARLDALEAENARLKAEADALKNTAAEFADREAALAAREVEARTAEIAEFAEGLVKAGKVLPRDKAGLVAYLASWPNNDGIEFADAEGAPVKQPADAWLRSFLTALPVQVDFAERGAPEAEGTASAVEFAAPPGAEVDPKGLETHRKAVAYQKEHKCTYDTAVDAVVGGA